VTAFTDGVLLAAVDGLGHGEEAAAAAKIAVTTLEEFPGESVIALVNRCHKRLLESRGVVMSLASFDARDRTMTWLGVGNVEGVLRRGDAGNQPPEVLLLRGGVVGVQLPPLSASIIPVVPGDTLVFATDGIQSGFADGLTVSDSPQHIADRILAQHGKGVDDALVLVARYVERRP
jgi:serine phosphatase RsbU (regulator of sigma subunit)